MSHAVIAQPVRPEPAIVWGKLWTKWNMIWFSKAMLAADQIWHWSHRRRGRELMHSVLACHFYSVPFPSCKSTEVLLVLYFNSLSLPLYTPSNSFKLRLSFVKERLPLAEELPCFFCVHLAFGDVLLQKSEDYDWKLNNRKYKRHFGFQYSPVTASIQSPPKSKDVFPINFRWILMGSAPWCCRVPKHTLIHLQARWDVVPPAFGWYQYSIVVSLS